MRMYLSIPLVFVVCCCFAQVPENMRSHPGFNERIADRKALVKELAEYRGINIHDEAVLQAVQTVPRHLFVPPELRKHAYRNNPLPIGYDQTISQPVIVASMTQMLEANKGDKILEIGTGSGYQAAVLAELGCEVYTIEIVPELGLRSKTLLLELGYTNVHVKIGDGYEGWQEHAPYDKIIITCAPEKVPQPLIDQLATGGWIVVPVGGEYEIQYLVILKRSRKGKITKEYKYPVRFVPMTGKVKD